MVSVIIPNYNHAQYLFQRIESILHQSYQDFEIIILDDFSSDDSRSIIERFRDHKKVSHIIINDHNTGSSFRQWKRGIELAKGEWLWIAESDDWCDSLFLETVLHEARNHPSCGLIYTLPCYVYPDGNKWTEQVDGTVKEYSGNTFASNRLIINNAIHNVSCVILRRNDVLHVDLESCASLKLCGDWLLYSQLCRITDVLEIRKSLCYYRIHSNNTSALGEKLGLSLLEGVEILTFLTSTFHIPPRRYSKQWGKEWAKHEKRFSFEKKISSSIKHAMYPYPLIRAWYKLYRLRQWLHQ